MKIMALEQKHSVGETVTARLRRVAAGQPAPAGAAAADALRPDGPVPAGGPAGRAGAAAAAVPGPCRGRCCRVDRARLPLRSICEPRGAAAAPVRQCLAWQRCRVGCRLEESACLLAGLLAAEVLQLPVRAAGRSQEVWKGCWLAVHLQGILADQVSVHGHEILGGQRSLQPCHNLAGISALLATCSITWRSWVREESSPGKHWPPGVCNRLKRLPGTKCKSDEYAQQQRGALDQRAPAFRR